MINIDIKYKGELTSNTFNRKFGFLYGSNLILDGFEVTAASPASATKVVLAPGAVVINGVTIECTDVQDITTSLGTVPLASQKTLYVYLSYDHAHAQCLFGSTETADIVNDANSIVLATLVVPIGASVISSGHIASGNRAYSMDDIRRQMYIALANDNTSDDATKNKLVSNAQMKQLAGVTAYVHPAKTVSNTTGTGLAFVTGLSVDSTGHIETIATRATLTKSDLTDLGIPAQDTTYAANDDAATDTTRNKLVSNAQMNKLKGLSNYTLTAPTSSALGGVKTADGTGISIASAGDIALAGIDGSRVVGATGHLHAVEAISGLASTLANYATQSDLTTLNARIDGLGSGMVWKTAVSSYSAIATTYPSPIAGWIVPVIGDTNYIYTGSYWTQLSPVPVVTTTANGMMLASDKVKFNAMTAGTDLPSGYHTTPWSQITGIPSSFSPSAHGHSDPVTNKVYAVYSD